jgi:hypothetical protein
LKNANISARPSIPHTRHHVRFAGQIYVSAILAVELDGDEYRQRFKCDKHFCGTEFDVVFRATFADRIVVPEAIVKKWREQRAAVRSSPQVQTL